MEIVMTEIVMTDTEHHLKSWPESFDAVRSGAKTFEVRVDDRAYNVGDTLVLREWQPDPHACGLAEYRSLAAGRCNLPSHHIGDHDAEAGYTGSIERVVVTYVYRGDEQGVPVPLRTGGLRPVVVMAIVAHFDPEEAGDGSGSE